MNGVRVDTSVCVDRRVVELWTPDKRLSLLAERFGVMHRPALH